MLKERLESILARIERTTLRCGRRPEDVRLVAVAKTKPADLVRQAIVAGAQIIGENYVQEAREKFETLIDLPVQ